MPQMAPLLWLGLFSMFLLSFLLFLILNFFISPPLKIKPSAKLKIWFQNPWSW
uniref:ATP synthase F0 subunit 8 n=1 Tax=Nephropsis grandis TaxID=2801450 RepID=UPI002435F7B7|nr:ATP synthase F0 subunit 8 [Nephropsis grandis]WEU77719.1 ATP synthase F0 subunit 8 [Nephropsis grandis]